MEPFFLDYLERLGSLHEGLKTELFPLPEAALDWAPGGGQNSVAVLVSHLSGAQRFWVGDVAGGRDSGRVRDTEFAARNLTPTALAHRLDEAFEISREVLALLNLADLSRAVTTPDGKLTFSMGWCLLHALEHTALHCGHAQLTIQQWHEAHDRPS